MPKRLSLFIVLTALTLSGCACSPVPVQPVPAESAVRWTPPESIPAESHAEADSIREALDLCLAFIAETDRLYPGYAPVLVEEDAAYFERQLSGSDADWDSLSAELRQTIVNLRQQVYRSIESTRKMDNPLPDGIEEFVRGYEARFREIGW